MIFSFILSILKSRIRYLWINKQENNQTDEEDQSNVDSKKFVLICLESEEINQSNIYNIKIENSFFAPNINQFQSSPNFNKLIPISPQENIQNSDEVDSKSLAYSQKLKMKNETFSISETRELITKSRKEGVNFEKLLQSTENAVETLQILNSFNINSASKFHTERNNINTPLDSQTGNKVTNLKGIKDFISSKSHIGSKHNKNISWVKKKKHILWPFWGQHMENKIDLGRSASIQKWIVIFPCSNIF